MLENDVKKSVLSEDEVLLLREKFIAEYSKKKGWNARELTSTQMLEIATQKEYKKSRINTWIIKKTRKGLFYFIFFRIFISDTGM